MATSLVQSSTLKHDMKTVDTIMERYRDAKIPIEKFELSEDDDCLFSEDLAFPLIVKWLDIALTNGGKDLSLYLTSHPWLVFTEKSVRELDVQECTLLPFSLSNGVVNCNSLTKLSLSDVKLDENMIQTLLNSYPLIVSCIFEYCSGYKTIILKRLSQVSLKLLKIKYCGGIWEIDAPNLESFEYTSDEITQLKISSELTQLKHSEISLQCLEKDLNAAWFLKLRKSL